MKIDEANLWSWLKKVEPLVPRGELHWQRVENAVKKGTPDVEAHFKRSFVAELKAIDRRPTMIIREKHWPDQVMFIHSRTIAGGLAWLLIQVGSGDNAKRYIIPGSHILKFAKSFTEADLMTYATCIPQTPLEALWAFTGER
jgi:hypothetical protein